MFIFPFIHDVQRGCQGAQEVGLNISRAVVRQIILLQYSYRILFKFLFRDQVSFTLTDPSWFYLNIPTVYLVTCQSSSLQSQLHPQLASSASQFALMLHIVTMQVWQAHLGFKIILYIFVALSDMSFQCTIFTPQATQYSLETGLLH